MAREGRETSVELGVYRILQIRCNGELVWRFPVIGQGPEVVVDVKTYRVVFTATEEMVSNPAFASFIEDIFCRIYRVGREERMERMPGPVLLREFTSQEMEDAGLRGTHQHGFIAECNFYPSIFVPPVPLAHWPAYRRRPEAI